MKVFLFIILVFLVGCDSEKIKPTISMDASEERIADYESWGTEVIFSELGDIQAILFTDHLRKYDSEKTTYLQGVKIDFYDEEGNPSTKLTSLKGRVDDITKNMFAIDSVVVKSDSGIVLETNQLTWQNKIRRITTDEFVTITSPDERIEGYGFESDQSLKNYKIYKITYSATVTDTLN
ncbi:MAG: LPS export ABC transporter periplasmic protein LptC [Bacteroidetes bacterium]|nr:LPS export ABC transporter periplasmic protein LptC [Bacteroidota bacterium]